jgi:sulfur carrier protein
MSVGIRVNGADRDVAEGATVDDLVRDLVERPVGVAVAVNDGVVARSEWAHVALSAGDRVEVLTATQGG